ncbi:MAG: hypothetical protein GY820_43325 [Gammaproteobacteria bacterium]|nr:hypothetical protein [Gammaproteobacteria bacterium]
MSATSAQNHIEALVFSIAALERNERSYEHFDVDLSTRCARALPVLLLPIDRNFDLVVLAYWTKSPPRS